MERGEAPGLAHPHRCLASNAGKEGKIRQGVPLSEGAIVPFSARLKAALADRPKLRPLGYPEGLSSEIESRLNQSFGKERIEGRIERGRADRSPTAGQSPENERRAREKFQA